MERSTDQNHLDLQITPQIKGIKKTSCLNQHTLGKQQLLRKYKAENIILQMKRKPPGNNLNRITANLRLYLSQMVMLLSMIAKWTTKGFKPSKKPHSLLSPSIQLQHSNFTKPKGNSWSKDKELIIEMQIFQEAQIEITIMFILN